MNNEMSNGNGSNGYVHVSPVDKLESAFMSCMAAITKEDTLTNVDKDEIRVDVEQGLSNFVEQARAMEGYFLKKRLEIASQKPELIIKDDVSELKFELSRKDDLLKKNYDKITHWQTILADLQSAGSQQGKPLAPTAATLAGSSQGPATPGSQGPLTPSSGRPNTPGSVGRPITPVTSSAVSRMHPETLHFPRKCLPVATARSMREIGIVFPTSSSVLPNASNIPSLLQALQVNSSITGSHMTVTGSVTEATRINSTSLQRNFPLQSQSVYYPFPIIDIRSNQQCREAIFTGRYCQSPKSSPQPKQLTSITPASIMLLPSDNIVFQRNGYEGHTTTNDSSMTLTGDLHANLNQYPTNYFPLGGTRARVRPKLPDFSRDHDHSGKQ